MDIQAMMAAMSDDEGSEKIKALKESHQKLFKEILPEGEGERMHDMSIRWTMVDVWRYCHELLGMKAAEEDQIKVARLVRELTDLLVEKKTIRNANRVPAASWFKTLVSLKDMDDE